MPDNPWKCEKQKFHTIGRRTSAIGFWGLYSDLQLRLTLLLRKFRNTCCVCRLFAFALRLRLFAELEWATKMTASLDNGKNVIVIWDRRTCAVWWQGFLRAGALELSTTSLGLNCLCSTSLLQCRGAPLVTSRLVSQVAIFNCLASSSPGLGCIYTPWMCFSR
jgi:hypothetical protein